MNQKIKPSHLGYVVALIMASVFAVLIGVLMCLSGNVMELKEGWHSLEASPWNNKSKSSN